MRELTATQQRIVEQIEAGWFSYGEIAENLGMGRTDVRIMVRELCAIFDCPMHLLPERTKG
jgi:biotin operon repressor